MQGAKPGSAAAAQRAERKRRPGVHLRSGTVEQWMRGTVLVGVLLVLLGAGALIFGQFRYSDTEPVLKAGPIQVEKKETHVVSIPTVAGVLLLVAGLGFVFMGMKRS